MPPGRLTALDASFLKLETASAHMHVAWRGRFAPGPGRPAITLARVRAQVASRLDVAPRFRQRLAFPPGGFANPVWVDDQDFDLAHHVVALSEEAEAISPVRFDALADQALSQPLQRTRPLWSLHLAPRLQDGSVGVLMKIHHAMVDGLSALALALLLLDVDPDAPEPPALPESTWAGDAPPGSARLAVGALTAYGAEPLRAAGRAMRAARSPARLTETLRRTALAVGEDVARPAPASQFNVPIGPQRTLVGHSVEIEAMLRIKRARRTSLNDVALAVVAGALNRLAQLQGVEPAPLKVMVPVSRRAPAQAGALGNRIAFVGISLPVHLRTPLARLEAIRAETQAFKLGDRAAGGEAILDGLGLLPGVLQAPFARYASSPRMYNLVVSNVPGPRFPVYLLGAECVEVLPVIPLSEGHALSVGVFSMRERLCFGGYADPAALPHAAELPVALADSAKELGEHSARRRGGFRLAA
jgi:diacylglycerol O-acyltransferase / wax synthase